jgi:hypothetical protein
MAMVFRPEILSLAPFEPRPPSRYGLGRQMVHDEWVFFLAGVIGSVQLIAEPLVLYRQHGANTSSGGIDPDREWSLRPALADYLQAAELTGACAEYLEAVEAEDDAVRDRLAEGARAYRRISENWALRGGLYGSAGLRRRARLLRQMWAAGAYGPRTGGGFGRAALGKDLVAGVALGLLAPGASGPSTAS